MKKITGILIVFLVVLYIGCGGVEDKKSTKRLKDGMYSDGSVDTGNIDSNSSSASGARGANSGSSSSVDGSSSSSSDSSANSNDGKLSGPTFEKGVFMSASVNYFDESQDVFIIDKKDVSKPIFNSTYDIPQSKNSNSYDDPEFGRVSTMVPKRVGYKMHWIDDNNKKYDPGDWFEVEDSGTYNFYTKWEEDPDNFFKESSVGLGSDFNIKMVSIPKNFVGAYNFNSDIETYAKYLNPTSFMVSTTDLTGAELIKLINLNKAKNWGFTTIQYLNKYRINYIYSSYEDPFQSGGVECDVKVNGVKVININDTMTSPGLMFANISDSNNGSLYPACGLNFAQAVIICNMMTAAYNETHSDKLTYAYAGNLTTEVKSPYVFHTFADVKNAVTSTRTILKTLAIDGATGFRLPRDYEYQILSSVIPYVDSKKKDYVYNNDNPGILKQNFISSGLCSSLSSQSESNFANFAPTLNSGKTNTVLSQETWKVNAGAQNAIGLYNCTGNVRKWLDTRINESDAFMLRSGSFILESDECRVGKLYDVSLTENCYSALLWNKSDIDIGMRVVRSL